MLSTEVERLMEVIANGIAIRGIYALMDQRLDLICGPDSLQNIDDPEVRRKITDFATAHGWAATRYQAGFILWPDSGIIRKARVRPPIASRCGR